MYRGGRPNILAKIQNRGWAIIHSLGILPDQFVTLKVTGRKSGKIVSFPLAMTKINGERYLVSMLGEETNWVRNVRAANGKARLVHGIIEQVLLKEIDTRKKAPILKAYLQIAPGARPHIPISKDAPISEFETIVSKYPIFRVETIQKKPLQRNLTTMIKSESILFKIAWILLAITGAAIFVFGLIVAVWPGSSNSLFLRAIGVASMGMGIFGVMITVVPYRRREKWAWFVLWYYPVFWSVHLIGRLPPGQEHIHQIVFIIISLAGLLLPMNAFFSRRAGKHI
jgi:hypothetical protein